MTVSVKDKVALVTGANRGIGKAIVESFIEHGASKVYLAVRNPESTQELTQKYGDKVVTLQVDMADKASIYALAEQAKDVQVLVNNAGVLDAASPISDNVEDALDYELNINLYGLIRITNAFLPILENNQESALVQLNSVASIKSFADFATYSASKAATYSITQALREKLANKAIQVLSVHPGPIATDMATQAGFDNGDSVTTVSEGIVDALAAGEFHLFPDSMAKHFEAAYQSYSDAMITGNPMAE